MIAPGRTRGGGGGGEARGVAHCHHAAARAAAGSNGSAHVKHMHAYYAPSTFGSTFPVCAQHVPAAFLPVVRREGQEGEEAASQFAILTCRGWMPVQMCGPKSSS
eukprot:gene18379-biopygen3934